MMRMLGQAKDGGGIAMMFVIDRHNVGKLLQGHDLVVQIQDMCGREFLEALTSGKPVTLQVAYTHDCVEFVREAVKVAAEQGNPVTVIDAPDEHPTAPGVPS